MIICGVKLTHDGGVALIDGDRLVFSIETEKLANNHRHTNIDDLELIQRLIRSHGYDPDQVDAYAFDGWRKTERVKPWGGLAARVELAPYRRGLRHRDLFHPYRLRTLDLEYTSYHHYAGHVASALCTSPAVAAGQDSYVLCWDGAMFPYLYHYDPATNRLRDLGPLFHMLGNTYHTLSMACPPFDLDVQWPHTLALPGKIMAYIAHGTPSDTAEKSLATDYARAFTRVFGDGPVPDEEASDSNGRRMLQTMRAGLETAGIPPEDMLASIHAFLGDLLVQRLTELVDRDGRVTPNLALVGGCALNIKWNRAVRDSGVCPQVWVPPFPNDAGSAIGTACCAMLERSGHRALDWDVYAGPALVDNGVAEGWTARACSLEELAGLLHRDGEPVLFLHGRAELGPRALGHRSILAPAVDPAMKDRLNRIKEREPYRPVAPIALEHAAPQVFAPGTPDPYMLFDHDVRPEWRDRVPAVVHIDGTARLQTVSHAQNPEIFTLLTAYERLSGVPLLCNTSANRKGSGFFPDLASAMEWNGVGRIWSDGKLYERPSAPDRSH